MTDEHRALFVDALNPTEMGPVVASRTMKRLHADGTISDIRVEIGVPQPLAVPYPPDSENETYWVCTARITGVPRILAITGISSLDAIISATYLVAAVLARLPFAAEIDLSLLPYFGLPVNPITTTPEQLDAEQKRPKELKIDHDAVAARALAEATL